MKLHPSWDVRPICVVGITETALQHAFLEGDTDSREEAEQTRASYSDGEASEKHGPSGPHACTAKVKRISCKCIGPLRYEVVGRRSELHSLWARSVVTSNRPRDQRRTRKEKWAPGEIQSARTTTLPSVPLAQPRQQQRDKDIAEGMRRPREGSVRQNLRSPRAHRRVTFKKPWSAQRLGR
jgi:hypothetical protein